MSEMAEQIVELVEERRSVSFAELENMIPGFGGGDKQWVLEGEGFSNIIMWVGLTDAACDALEELRAARRIHPTPASFLVYLIDGRMLQLPLAKRKRHYKKPHWAPIVFNPGPGPDVIAPRAPGPAAQSSSASNSL